jgi:hypothetical protein
MPDFAFSVEASPMATNDLIPLFLSDQTEEPEQPGIGKSLGQSGYFVPYPHDEYFGFNGGRDRLRDFSRKSNRAPCERHGFPGRHIGVSG